MANTTASKTGAPGNSRIVFHTPGPWTADDGCIYASGTPVALAYSTTVSAQESDANARLMAASPALLGAVVALVFAVMDDDPAVMAQALRQAVGALALVEGGAA
jgi:hypothetical protein